LIEVPRYNPKIETGLERNVREERLSNEREELYPRDSCFIDLVIVPALIAVESEYLSVVHICYDNEYIYIHGQ